jgi:hypothetical protein
MTVSVTLVQRIRGRWKNEDPAHVHLSEEEVGKHIRYKWGKTTVELYNTTPVGEWVMTHFYGTMTQIADCYKAAGDDIYREWCEKGIRRNPDVSYPKSQE